MIRIGFNLLLFVVLLILFIGYCWTIIIERDYNTKIEHFNNKLHTLNTLNTAAPINVNAPGLSTPESIDAAYCKYKKANKSKSKINICNNSQLLPSKIPSVAQVNNTNRWKYNDFTNETYPDSELIIPYMPISDIPNLNTNYTEDKPNLCTDYNQPFSSNETIAYNDDLLYTNTGNNPWEHHKVHNSIPDNPEVKFTNAYYYEFTNELYLENIKTALVVPCDLLADAVLTSNWGDKIDPSIISVNSNESIQEVVDGYNNCLLYIINKINNATSMILPGDIHVKTPSRIQIVHDIFKSYKIHTTSQSMYLIHMELILYRLSKYNGKHIEVTCTAKLIDSNWIIHVVAIRILGVVPEQDIALYPVIPHDEQNVEQLQVVNDINKITAIIYDPKNEAYLQPLLEREKTYQMIGATDKKMANLLNNSNKDANA